jgi:hypothetical protein
MNIINQNNNKTIRRYMEIGPLGQMCPLFTQLITEVIQNPLAGSNITIQCINKG